MEHKVLNKIKYFDAWGVVNSTPYFLYMFIGGRGIGKTYSTLKGAVLDDAYIMYVRRSEAELKNCCKFENNPFTTINRDLNRNMELTAAGDTYLIHEGEEIKGIAGALSTFGKFRGSDFSKVDYIIFDEFIQLTNYKIRDEAGMFFNMIETVQRNRELNGEKSIKVILLSNANTIDNAIIRELHLAEVIHRLKKSKEEIYTDIDRGLYLQVIKDNSVSNAKKETALYRLTKGSNFYDMAIDNEFTGDNFEDVYKLNFRELTPVVAFENVYFYKVKNKDLLYASYRKSDVEKYTKDTITAFRRNYGLLFDYYIVYNRIIYYDYDVKLIVKNMFN